MQHCFEHFEIEAADVAGADQTKEQNAVAQDYELETAKQVL